MVARNVLSGVIGDNGPTRLDGPANDTKGCGWMEKAYDQHPFFCCTACDGM